MDRVLNVFLQTSRIFYCSIRNIQTRPVAVVMASNRAVRDIHGINENSYEKSYENAIKTLNTLQTNSEVLALIAQNPNRSITNIPETIIFMERGGLSLIQLDSINVIHVSGTKGKGTTCAFVESILRCAGLRTGFFSSPHLICVRERIRINGKPLSEQTFSQYFFDVYERMAKEKTSENDMPGYFRFLTCMAYYVFFHEQVDVAIVEVGIGGTYDSTNIVRKPVVVGITSLGLEHQNILGNTIQEITIHKAGIMKPKVPAVTILNHSPEVLELLRSHAESVKCPFYKAPPLQNYEEMINLGIDDSQVCRTNAGLAIQLANIFLSQCFPFVINSSQDNLRAEYETRNIYSLKKWHLDGLEQCTWHGRFQVLKRKDNLSYYLDGAHTEESLIAATNWFMKMTRKDSLRVLVFYITGNRDAEKLMKPFANGYFDILLLCPLIISTSKDYETNTCHNPKPYIGDNWSAIRSDSMNNLQILAEAWAKLEMNGKSPKSLIFNSVQEVLQYIDGLSDIQKNMNYPTTPHHVSDKCHDKVNVLFTGSLHMVGTFLSVLDPELSV